MEVLRKVVVGSRLHNLCNENSDYDYRGIFINPLKDVLSPYKKEVNTSWIEGDEDNTAFELRNFCKMATQGNPTVLEILYSGMVEETTPVGDELVANRHRFLDSTRIYEACKGYAHNQYNKMNMFTPDQRTPKFAVAYLRSLYQGTELLKTGELPSPMDGEFREFLMKVKYNFTPDLIPELSKRFAVAQVELAEAYQQNHDKFKPDFEWIENFIYQVYTKGL